MPLQHIIYDLNIGQVDGIRKITSKEQGGVTCNFSAPVTSQGLTKIYVLTSPAGEFVYVGHTIRSIGQISLRSNTPYNYKWLTVGSWEKLHLHVFLLEIDSAVTDTKLYGEAIEAEVVWLIRSKTGYWPLGQNEIHFNNNFSTKSKEEARVIFDLLSSPQ
ncbi:hypothetical protein [Neolewinella agarilytica]|uniref:hypothetical protein n=1 Tax=Neolewinella agarilytica TaxID=478744 RepID=UPI002352F8BD|nr:hypothetical protein [Neolewinella agarilytica]